MGVARAHELVDGPAEAVEALWCEPARWPSWIDGFGHVVALGEGWPEAGTVLDWQSRPRGRGRVRERVQRREPPTLLVLDVEDEQLRGTQEVTFTERDAAGVLVTLTLEYSLKERNPLTPLVDRLFIRRAMTASLQRTLARFARERAADADLA